MESFFLLTVCSKVPYLPWNQVDVTIVIPLAKPELLFISGYQGQIAFTCGCDFVYISISQCWDCVWFEVFHILCKLSQPLYANARINTVVFGKCCLLRDFHFLWLFVLSASSSTSISELWERSVIKISLGMSVPKAFTNCIFSSWAVSH